ncbi:MAG TPA: cadherin-like beta sandwich domain-containing protein [Fibrobacteria bacterium]|nr:cadherin-like beta sandwich domain-containing protein [Fibrobacteria bacterium]
MKRQSGFNRLTRFRAFGALALLAALSVFWACHLNSADGEDHFDLRVDSALAACDSLMVILEDTSGAPIDTLFHDTLESLSQLGNLSAAKYSGGKARVRIVGRNVDGFCAEQIRSFDDRGGPVRVDTVSLPGAAPVSVEIDPPGLEMSADDPSVEVLASIKPAFADQVFEWSVEDASIATIDFPNGPSSGKVLVIPQKNGTVKIRARAKKDTSKSADLVVKVGSVSGKTISLAPDTLKLYLGGPGGALAATVSPESSGTAIVWSSLDEKIAKVSSKGVVSGIGEGSTSVKARFGDAVATAQVKVKRDTPVLTVASKTGAGVNVPIVFSPKATQEFGSIVMFKWDLNGDGNWDDSLPGPYLGNNVDLPAQTAKYSKLGEATARFLVRDTEGNEAVVTVHLDIGDQPPEILALSNDTVITIKDSIPLRARVRDGEGKVAWIGWDFENDGKFDDSLKANDSIVDFKSGHRYPKAGTFAAKLKAVDDNGKVRLDSVKVRVALDRPVADAGKDTTVIAGTAVNFHAGGRDSLGAIAKRELKIGSGPYLNLGKPDTTLKLPGDSGSVPCVVRVTDDDGNADEDTMIVTIVAPDRSNNQLAGLVPSAGTLSPVFKPVTIIYSLAVAYADSQLSLTATTFDPSATLAVNGKPLASGKLSDPVDVKVGTTVDVFKIVVTAQDGNQRVYSVSVTRAPSADASLSKLETNNFGLKPPFSPATLGYADTVAFSIGSVSVKPTTAHPAAKVTINDTAVVSGSAGKPVPLIVGDNLIKVLVTAQDGKTKSTYTLKVVRRAKLILTRIAGGESLERTDSLEFPLGSTVTITSPDTVGFHFQKWVVTSGTGTLEDTAANPGKLTLKSDVVRVLGVQVFNVYKIAGSVSGFAGGVFAPNPITIQHGKDTALTITPLVGYRVLSLTDNGKPASLLGTADGFGPRTYKLTNVTEKHDLVATFKKTYTLTTSVAAGESGTISPSGTVEVDSGAGQVFAITSGSPSTGVIISSLLDNGAEKVGAVTGDPMTTSKYTLEGITANHTITGKFSVKTFKMIVTGVNLCIRPVCTGIKCLIKLCPAGIGADTLTVGFNSQYVITTDSLNGLSRAFRNWSKDGVAGFSASTTITTPPITADISFQANYNNIICCIEPCPRCITPLDPLLTDPTPSRPIQAIPSTSSQISPFPEN